MAKSIIKELEDFIGDSPEIRKSCNVSTDIDGYDCFDMISNERCVRIQEFKSCIVVSVKTYDSDHKEIIKAWKLDSKRIYFNSGIIDEEHNTFVTTDEFKFIFVALAKIYEKINAPVPVKPLYFGDFDTRLPKEFTEDDFDQKFLNKVGERLQAIDIDADIKYLIKSAMKLYEETTEKELLIDIAAAAMKGYIYNNNCELISWSKMTEFSDYPLKQRVYLYIDAWNGSGNGIFLLELVSLMYKNYNK